MAERTEPQTRRTVLRRTYRSVIFVASVFALFYIVSTDTIDNDLALFPGSVIVAAFFSR